VTATRQCVTATRDGVTCGEVTSDEDKGRAAAIIRIDRLGGDKGARERRRVSNEADKKNGQVKAWRCEPTRQRSGVAARTMFVAPHHTVTPQFKLTRVAWSPCFTESE
jgi:predicted RNA-binding protein with EMAP domain